MKLVGDQDKEVRIVCSSWTIDFYVDISKAEEFVTSGQARIHDEKTIIFSDCEYNTKHIKKHIKSEVLKRDSGKCVYCSNEGKIYRIKKHHYLGGKQYSISNRITCCEACNKIQSQKETRSIIQLENSDKSNHKESLKRDRIIEIERILKMDVLVKSYQPKKVALPSPKEYLLYCDASVQYEKNKTVLANVIIKNGKIVRKKRIVIDNAMDVTLAELRAVYEGINLLKESCIKGVKVFTDNSSVATALKKNKLVISKSIMKTIMSKQKELNLEFDWIPRKKNKMADWVTKGRGIVKVII